MQAIIVDDEKLARFEMRFLLKDYPQIEIVGEAENLRQANHLIKTQKPELIFLDIQLGNESGFDLLDNNDIQAQLVFVTAYDEYAVRAFEVNAIDYLLKPVNPERLKNTIQRIGRLHRAKEKDIKKLDYEDRVYVNSDRCLKFVKISTIQYIQANGDYSDLHCSNGKVFSTYKSLKDWEQILPDKYFNRIHRSTIINNEYIENIDPWFNYSFQVYLKGTTEPLMISRRYGVKLKGKLNLL
jgi:two-component system, LytTR family, response regulator